MDERKPNISTDHSDEQARAGEATPSAAASPRPSSGSAVPLLTGKTMIWRGGVEQRLSAAPCSEPPAPSDVVIGRTVIASGESSAGSASSAARGSSLGKTQIWRTGLGNPAHDSSASARSLAETNPTSRRSAELWAAQLPHGPHTLITTLQQPIEASASGGEPTPDQSQTRPVDWLARTKQAKEAASSRYDESTDRFERKLRRSLLRPGPRALHALRVTGIVVIVAALGAIAGTLCGAPQAKTHAAKPAELAELTRRAPDSTRPPAAEPSGSSSAVLPAAAEEPNARVRLVQPAAAGSALASSPRAAVDALIAGDRALALARYRALAEHDPDQLAYGAAATILAEIEGASPHRN